MSRDDHPDRARVSLLEALVDRDPVSTEGLDRRRDFAHQSERVQVSLRQDIRDLLNTRQRVLPWSEHLTELTSSVFDFGVEDVAGVDLSTAERRQQFVSRLASVIRKHDSRFVHVKVEPVEEEHQSDRVLRFRMEARVRVENRTDRAVYNFELETATRQFR